MPVCTTSNCAPVSARSVCSSGGAPVTSTVSVILPGVNCTSTRVLVLTASVISLRVSFLNPDYSTVTEYCPERKSGNV